MAGNNGEDSASANIPQAHRCRPGSVTREAQDVGYRSRFVPAPENLPLPAGHRPAPQPRRTICSMGVPPMVGNDGEDAGRMPVPRRYGVTPPESGRPGAMLHPSVLYQGSLTKNCSDQSCPNGAAYQSPGLPGSSATNCRATPGYQVTRSTPTGLRSASRQTEPASQPLWGRARCDIVPKVAARPISPRARQPWASFRSPVGAGRVAAVFVKPL